MLSRTLLPGYTILGIINNGAGVERLALEARSAGFIVGIYTPRFIAGVAKFSDFVVKGSLNNLKHLRSFIKRCTVVTYVGIITNDHFTDCLKESTKVPQGIEIFDLTHDRSIQHAFLDMLHVQSVPYRTIVELSDIQRGISTLGYPSILKPIQTSTLNDRQLIINNPVDISTAAGMLEVGTYILEPDLYDEQHFSILVIKSKDGSLGQFPIVESHYHNKQLVEVDACPNLKVQVRHQLEASARRVATQLHYVGGIEISLIYSRSHHIYVEGIQTPFNLVSDLLAFNGINVYQQYLKAIIGGKVRSDHSRIYGIVRQISRNNYQRIQQLWVHRSNVFLSINRDAHFGHLFIRTQMPKIAIKRLKIDLKNH